MAPAPERLQDLGMAIIDPLVDVALGVKARCPHFTMEQILAAAAGTALLLETVGPQLIVIAQALQDL
jgi:hypothetical protein